MVKHTHTGRGPVVKRPGVLSKVQVLKLVLGVGGLFPSSNFQGWGVGVYKNRPRVSGQICGSKLQRAITHQVTGAGFRESACRPPALDANPNKKVNEKATLKVPRSSKKHDY